jgi:aryl-alcohol dehydrogenase-like predicted oxidoreductase
MENRRDCEFHVRSALLQGLLLSDDPRLWQRAAVQDAAGVRRWIDDIAARCGREDRVDLCLAYVRSKRWADGVVVGVETLTQLASNLRYFSTAVLSQEQVAAIEDSRPRLTDNTLNPVFWKKG